MTKKTATPKTTPSVSMKKMTTTKMGVGGTKESPWTLTTPSGQSEYQAYRDETLEDKRKDNRMRAI